MRAQDAHVFHVGGRAEAVVVSPLIAEPEQGGQRAEAEIIGDAVIVDDVGFAQTAAAHRGAVAGPQLGLAAQLQHIIDCAVQRMGETEKGAFARVQRDAQSLDLHLPESAARSLRCRSSCRSAVHNHSLPPQGESALERERQGRRAEMLCKYEYVK